MDDEELRKLFGFDFEPTPQQRAFTCAHSLTTEPDENGDAICLNCGTRVEIRFNLDRFRERIRKLLE